MAGKGRSSDFVGVHSKPAKCFLIHDTCTLLYCVFNECIATTSDPQRNIVRIQAKMKVWKCLKFLWDIKGEPN